MSATGLMLPTPKYIASQPKKALLDNLSTLMFTWQISITQSVRAWPKHILVLFPCVSSVGDTQSSSCCPQWTDPNHILLGRFSGQKKNPVRFLDKTNAPFFSPKHVVWTKLRTREKILFWPIFFPVIQKAYKDLFGNIVFMCICWASLLAVLFPASSKTHHALSSPLSWIFTTRTESDGVVLARNPQGRPNLWFFSVVTPLACSFFPWGFRCCFPSSIEFLFRIIFRHQACFF